MKYPTYDFTAANGVPFRVRIVRHGQGYGVDDKIVHAHPDEVLVEFFDRGYTHTPNGQFVSRYNATTLLGSALVGRVGLMLDGRVSPWVVDGASMLKVLAFIHGVKEASE